MAITIDQFLRDLTERRFLSGEDLNAYRRKLSADAQIEPASELPLTNKANGSPSATHTLPNQSTLVLCDCLIKKQLASNNQLLTFDALRLKDGSSAVVHVLMPTDDQPALENGNAGSPHMNGDYRPSESLAIRDVSRQQEMVCISCQPLEAESLADVVSENGPLPVDLATESLLQAVKLIQKTIASGLEMSAVSASHLFLDEEGHVHLSGNDPARFLPSSNTPSSELFHSLGRLYSFLQTGEMDSIESEQPAGDANSSFDSSAKLVSNRLFENHSSPAYQNLEELLGDLERMLAGDAVILPEVPARPAIAEKPPSANGKPVESSIEETKPQPPQPMAVPQASQSTSNHMVRVAVFAGLCVAATIAAWMLLKG